VPSPRDSRIVNVVYPALKGWAMLCRPDMRDFRFFLAILTARSVNTRARSGAVPLAGLECAGDADSGLEPAQRGAEGSWLRWCRSAGCLLQRALRLSHNGVYTTMWDIRTGCASKEGPSDGVATAPRTGTGRAVGSLAQDDNQLRDGQWRSEGCVPSATRVVVARLKRLWRNPVAPLCGSGFVPLRAWADAHA
jgi:hypothetical protein